MNKNIHNPVLNGATKKMIMLVVMFIGVITIISISFAALVFTKGMHADNNGIMQLEETILAEDGIFGAVAMAGISALGLCLKQFMDTRDSKTKSADKLAILKEKNSYKLEKIKLRKGGNNEISNLKKD